MPRFRPSDLLFARYWYALLPWGCATDRHTLEQPAPLRYLLFNPPSVK
jgi:hypothetical protein